MSIYNGSQPLEFREAVLSITIRQSYQPMQFVLVIDGPVSKELENEIDILKKSFHIDFDILRLANNMGLSEALNAGIKLAKFDLVARMDDDDISTPDRLKLQYQFMQSHQQIQVLGGQITGWSQDMSRCILNKKLPTKPHELKTWAKQRCPLNHPTVIFRKKAICSVGGYPNIHPEDYLLWVKIIKHGYLIANLPQILVKMRIENAIQYRRGWKMLRGELYLFSELKKIGFISTPRYYFNVLTRVILRGLPSRLRLALYQLIN